MSTPRGGDGGHYSSEFCELMRALRGIDFELAYLALLTCEGIKPLSRWEKPLDESGLRLLRGTSLFVRSIRRTVEVGAQVTETIFSRTPGYVQVYESSFGGTVIDKSADTRRLEGFLFGYPSCCVDQYIRQPYVPNNLAREDQEILFYWACKDCKVTPLLLREYRSAHEWICDL
ncbi:MAG: hypothetical protein P8Z79_12350 [Sedimentisphaerales bacterium]|jgi:hypothetical protein